MVENISSSQRGCNLIKIAILRRHYCIVSVVSRGEIYCSVGKSRVATKLNGTMAVFMIETLKLSKTLKSSRDDVRSCMLFNESYRQLRKQSLFHLRFFFLF